MRGLPRAVRQSLEKARESALLAVEVYNKPAITFKTGGYVSLMVIAWTALFHAVFFKRKVKPYYPNPKHRGRYLKVDGDYKHWELRECVRQYYGSDTQNPVRKNLEFFIPLRNKIEHRSVPELDASIFGECQSFLLNFDDLLEQEFGAKYRIRESLSFALQLFPSSQNLAQAVKGNPVAKEIAGFISRYRSSLAVDVVQSGKFAFKAFLIQVANHKGKEALPVQFVHWDKLTDEEKENLQRFVAMVKYKHIPVADTGELSPGEVAKRVHEAFGNPKLKRGEKEVDKFNVDWHTRCWRKFKVRPPGKSAHPEKTVPKYCIYDGRHNDYGYTDAWVEFLIKKFGDDVEYDALYPKRHK